MPRNDTRSQLIRCVIDLSAEHGIENVTVRKIADRLDISEATLYRHFSGRDDLMSGAFLEVEGRLSDALKKLNAREYSDAEEAMHAVWTEAFHYLLNHRNETMFLIRFRYSSLYTMDVRLQRKIYSGAYKEEVMGFYQRFGMKSCFYKGFVLNYMFEMGLSFAEKVQTGRFTLTPEREVLLWKMAYGTLCTMLEDPAARVEE